MTAGIFTDDGGITFSIAVPEPDGTDRRVDKVFPLRRGEECNKRHMMLLVWALESGKYQQGTEKLRPRDNNYCCLGVACDISGLGVWKFETYQGWKYIVGTDLDAQEGDYYLPEAVQEWLGVDDNNPAIAIGTAPWGHEKGVSLGELNDNDPRYDFKAIAAVIRKVFLEG